MNDPTAHNAYVNEVCDIAKADIEANSRLPQAEKDRVVRDIEELRKRGLVAKGSFPLGKYVNL